MGNRGAGREDDVVDEGGEALGVRRQRCRGGEAATAAPARAGAFRAGVAGGVHEAYVERLAVSLILLTSRRLGGDASLHSAARLSSVTAMRGCPLIPLNAPASTQTHPFFSRSRFRVLCVARRRRRRRRRRRCAPNQMATQGKRWVKVGQIICFTTRLNASRQGE